MNSASAKTSVFVRLVAAGLCGAAFFAAYLSTNAAARASGTSASAFCALDHAVPFLPWTIVPYWSLDALFVTAFLVQTDRASLRMHTARVLLGIGAACAAFLAFPLRCEAARGQAPGIWRPWFDALGGLDLPYNQAPSLHIILLMIVWHAHVPKLPSKWRPLAYAWGLLIGLSTVTTRQHGLIDVATGTVVGALIVYGVRREPWLKRAASPAPKLAARYGALSLGAAAAACAAAPYTYWGALALGWTAFAAGLTALAYAVGAPDVYAKRNGRVHWSAKLVLAPVLFPQRFIHRRLAAKPSRAQNGVSYGPAGGPIPAGAALLDLTAEHDTAHIACRERAEIPMLDLVAPTPGQLTHAADTVQRLARNGPVHVVCALGVERSALVVAAWHRIHNGAASSAEAVERVRVGRPDALPNSERLSALAALTACGTTA